jgi:hypothetical protein
MAENPFLYEVGSAQLTRAGLPNNKKWKILGEMGESEFTQPTKHALNLSNRTRASLVEHSNGATYLDRSLCQLDNGVSSCVRPIALADPPASGTQATSLSKKPSPKF